LAKIAAEVRQALTLRAEHGAPGGLTSRVLAQGDGWVVEDVVCTSGPQDRPFEERHSWFRVAVDAAGSFQYRSEASRELMAPGSLLLGNAGQFFECGHEHGAGDRCLSFGYAPHYFEILAADAGARRIKPNFPRLRVPPLRQSSSLVARAYAGLAQSIDGATDVPWDELSVQLAAQAVQLAAGSLPHSSDVPPSAEARVTRTVRMIERDLNATLALGDLAREARLSPYHFLRTFERLTGVTPHQYVRRMRLREAAMRLATESARILDIALDCGFGDVSNFNRAFRAQLGVSPRVYRQQMARSGRHSTTLRSSD
jgi:AraC family transcriptional regulator